MTRVLVHAFRNAATAIAIAATNVACSARVVDAVTTGDARAVIHKVPDAGPREDRDQGPMPNVPGYHTVGSRIVDPSGNPIPIKAVSWYGLESNTFAPLGLYQLSLRTILTQVQAKGFTTLRMTWSSETLDPRSTPMSINGVENPDLVTLKTPLAILDEIVQRAPEFGLNIILSRHQSSAGHQDPLWYNADYSSDQFVADWKKLAMRYAGNPTVIGCDLQNDLRGEATWGDGNAATDWKIAAETAGNAILSVNPAVLIFVQGIEKSSDGSYYWRGGNLKDADRHPIKLTLPDRLVYAAQDFSRTAQNPPQGAPPPWFSAAGYPGNLEGVWQSNWGYLLDRGPVLLSAFGTPYKDASDQEWLSTLEGYIEKKPGLGFAYWALNPESQDVAGIYTSQWGGINSDLVNALQPILGP